MKKLLLFLNILVSLSCFSQPVTQRASPSLTTADGRLMVNLNFYLPRYLDTTAANLQKGVDTCGAIIFTYPGNKIWKRSCNPKKWENITNGLLNISDSITQYLTPYQASQTYVAIQTQLPTASLSGGSNMELHSAGIFNSTLNWGAGRAAANSTQNATNPLASIVVNGINQTFTQPSAGSSTSGTQAISLFYNTNRTVFNVVTTTDGKTATATTEYNFFPKYYIGYSTTSTPSDADLIAGINTIFPATTRVTSGTLASPASSSYIFFAVPASFGTPVVTINAAGVTYNNTTRSVTNASGYTQSYIVSVSPFATAAGVSYSIN